LLVTIFVTYLLRVAVLQPEKRER